MWSKQTILTLTKCGLAFFFQAGNNVEKIRTDAGDARSESVLMRFEAQGYAERLLEGYGTLLSFLMTMRLQTF